MELSLRPMKLLDQEEFIKFYIQQMTEDKEEGFEQEVKYAQDLLENRKIIEEIFTGEGELG